MDEAEVNSLFPNTNQLCSAYMYVIEVVLRELVVEELTKTRGSKWYKSALPGGDIMNKYQECRKYQKERPWVRAIPLHPVYYLDFPDLATIIEKRDNWSECLKKVFFKQKEALITNLRLLEPIRNDLVVC